MRQADVPRLPFADGRFQVWWWRWASSPWSPRSGRRGRRASRVLAPGGTIIVTADNRRRLNRLLEPRENPVLGPVRVVRRAVRKRAGWVPAGAPAHLHRASEVDALLERAAVTVVRRTTVGYGPFTVLGRPALPDAAGTRLNEILQRAGARHPRLRGAGWHYVVAGVKDSRPRGA